MAERPQPPLSGTGEGAGDNHVTVVTSTKFKLNRNLECGLVVDSVVLAPGIAHLARMSEGILK